MKTTFAFSLYIVMMTRVWAAAAPISVESFSQNPDAQARREMIRQALPEQKAELMRIDHRLLLLKRYGGEAGLEKLRESLIATDRGVGAPLALIATQFQFCGLYISVTLAANEAAGMPSDQQRRVLLQLETEQETIRARESIVRELVYRLAASPQAIKLNQKAQAMCDQLQNRMLHFKEGPPITEVERKSIDGEVDAIIAELGTLPKLSSEQVEKEHAAMSDDQLPLFGSY